MKRSNKILSLVVAALLVATIFGLIHTRGASSTPPGYQIGTSAAAGSSALADQAALVAAQGLVQMPTSAEELPYAQGALRLADQETDLAFAWALLDATQHPPVLSAEAKKIQARLQRSEDGLAAGQALVTQLTADTAKATGSRKDALDEQLELAKARLELRQDQVDDAKQDLIREGGDPKGRIQAMVQEHQAASQSSDSTKVNVSAPGEAHGLVQRFQLWWALHQKQLQLWRAKQQAISTAEALSATHQSLEAQTAAQDDQAATPTALGGDEPRERGAGRVGLGRPARTAPASSAQAASPNPGQSADDLATTRRRSADRRAMFTLDKRIDNDQQLANTYGQWIAVVAAEERVHINRALRGILVILAIALIALFVDAGIERVLGTMSMDRRHVETLRSTTRVTLQIVSVLLILLVVFGPPTQLGTFLGLAGAGLTVALKDFIISFLGWFVLMGKGGIRMGDWVEINGVSGEVVELGVFHTVLLETGNWTDTGHPTGRRVTFTNSYAVEGHYFNFSTTGQWLWDELKIVLPGAQNPYPLVDAIQKKVTEATAEAVQKAEYEWQGATKSHEMHSLSAAPTISVKPIVGGTEISVRYITSAHQRSEVRAKLNHAAVDLLGTGIVPQPDADSPKPALTPN